MHHSFARAAALAACILSALVTSGCGQAEKPPWPIDSQIDCNAIPEGPFESELFIDSDLIEFADDLAFDGQGHFAVIDEENLVLVDADAGTRLVPLDAPFEDRTKGVRYLPDGRLLVSWNLANRVMQLFPDGSVRTWLQDLVMPKQLYADFDGNVWLSEFSYYKLGEEITTDRISRVGPDGVRETVAKGGIAAEPKGLVYDERRRALFFVAGAGTELILGRVDIGRDGEPAEPIALYTRPGAAGEGIAMDGCGNLYAIDAMFSSDKNDKSRLLRLRLDEKGNPAAEVEVVARFPGWVNNIQFGAGPGFSPTAIYGTGFLESRVFRVDVGVPGAPVPMPDWTKLPSVPAMGPDEPIDLEFCEFPATVYYSGGLAGWLSVTAWDEWPPTKQDLGNTVAEKPAFPYTGTIRITKPYTEGDPVTVLARVDAVSLLDEPFAQPLLTGRSDFAAVDCSAPPAFAVYLQDSYGPCPGEAGRSSNDPDAACSGPGEYCLDLGDQGAAASLCASYCAVDRECPVATADGVTAAACRPIGESSYCVIPCEEDGDCPNPGATCAKDLSGGICVFLNG